MLIAAVDWWILALDMSVVIEHVDVREEEDVLLLADGYPPWIGESSAEDDDDGDGWQAQ